jgi:hypothetical protein
MSPAAALARAIASRECLPPPASIADGRCTAPERAVHRCALARPPERVPCPVGCGRTIRRRSRGRSCRACWDASPGKSAQARAAARANPTPGGHPRRPR